MTKAATNQGGPCLKELARYRQWEQKLRGEGRAMETSTWSLGWNSKVVLSQPGLCQKPGVGPPYCLAVEMMNRQPKHWRKQSPARRPGRSWLRPKDRWPSCCLGFWGWGWRHERLGEIPQWIGPTPPVGKNMGGDWPATVEVIRTGGASKMWGASWKKALQKTQSLETSRITTRSEKGADKKIRIPGQWSHKSNFGL